MKNAHPKSNEMSALRPVGLALAAVVAGLGAGKAEAEAPRAHAPLEPSTRERNYVVDPTNHPAFEEDPSMIVGASEPVAPLRGAPREHGDRFKR